MSKAKERLNKFLFIMCLIGSILCVYVVIESLINQNWMDAFVYGSLGLACFANPLYEGIKKYK